MTRLEERILLESRELSEQGHKREFSGELGVQGEIVTMAELLTGFHAS
jgi:hypothetical protein